MINQVVPETARTHLRALKKPSYRNQDDVLFALRQLFRSLDVGYLPKSVIADPALLSAIFKNSFKMSCPM